MMFRIEALIVGAALGCFCVLKSATAITIDDFTVGPITVDGPNGVASQTNLDPAHVIGGARDISVERAGNRFQVDAAEGLFRFSADSQNYGYFQLTYGLNQSLAADFTAGGHDRFRFRFTGGGMPGPTWTYVNVPGKPTSDGLGIDWAARLMGGSGVVEVPFTKYAADFTDVSSFTIYTIRQSPTTSFAIDEISTSGPPLAGDYNRDGIVDLADYNEWRRVWGITIPGGVLLGPDGNGDGRVDAADYVVWRKGFDTTPAASTMVVSAPEPGSQTLFTVALVGIAVVGSRARGRTVFC